MYYKNTEFCKAHYFAEHSYTLDSERTRIKYPIPCSVQEKSYLKKLLKIEWNVFYLNVIILYSLIHVHLTTKKVRL